MKARQLALPRPSLTHGDGQTDGQSDANCLHCQSHCTTPPPVAMCSPPHHGNQLAVSRALRGSRRKREFVCHAITFKRWWHVSKSLSAAPLAFFVSLLVTFSLSFLSAPSASPLPALPLVSILSKTPPGCYLFIPFVLLFLFHPLPFSSLSCILSVCPARPIIFPFSSVNLGHRNTPTSCVPAPWQGCLAPGPCPVQPHVRG